MDMDQPVPFITVKTSENDKGDAKFSVNQKALEMLSQIEGKIGVVAVAGLYRTGKSYVLNRLAGSSRGFAVGSFVEPCTQGIHMWIVRSPPRDVAVQWPGDMTLVLLDTEGLGSYTKSKTYDVKMFALAVLLSSLFVYNSMGSIDEGALDRLSLVAELSKNVRLQSSSDAASTDADDPHALSRFFPQFLWLVRDFSLRLELDGKPVTATEYLENILKPLQGDAERVRGRNQIRSSVVQYFPNRTCFTLKRPVTDEKLLQKLEDLTEADLRPQFLEQMTELIKLIFSTVTPKRLYGEMLNGRMFCDLTSAYVNALNTGGVPTIRSAWDSILFAECQRQVDQLTHSADAQLSTLEDTFPVDSDALEDHYEQLRSNTIQQYRSALRGKGGDGAEQWELKLTTALRDRYNQSRSKNAAQSRRKCSDVMESVCRDIDEKLSSADTMSFDLLDSLWEQAMSTQFATQAAGPARFEVACDYYRKRYLQHSSKVHRSLLAKQKLEQAAHLKTKVDELQAEKSNVEKLLEDVKGSWLRSRDEVTLLAAENTKLIGVVAKFSDVLNDELSGLKTRK
ncbi:hypothetical protein RI367_001870 [Sorochytrium milnesiophthora]